jgi:hypothetical protein
MNATAPKIIDLPSIDANWRPSFITVKIKVAIATDGAALRSPAKLFGRNKSPKSANAETANPQTTTLNRMSPTVT